jgi:hypothetical protein
VADTGPVNLLHDRTYSFIVSSGNLDVGPIWRTAPSDARILRVVCHFDALLFHNYGTN